MAMIKCPECGHQVSDQAPTCPYCGVEISGKVMECPQCGTVYFKRLAACPFCHHPTVADGQSQGTPPTPPTPPSSDGEKPRRRKKSRAPWIIGFIIAIAICAAVGFYYVDAKNARELEAYEYAIQSQDPDVLQSFLDNYKDGRQEHIDSIESRLSMIKQGDQDWRNAVVSGSKAALEAYMSNYPNSSHKIEAIHKIDSLDWIVAITQNTPDALQRYLDQHMDGEHVDDANMALKQLDATTVSDNEKTAINSVIRKFFQSINSKSEGGLRTTVADLLDSFLGKDLATADDVVAFMHKIYKDDVKNMTWRLNNDMKIDKKEVGEGQYEYTSQFSASQEIDKTDGSKHTNYYRITAGINTDGRISTMSMVKVGQ